MPATVPGLPAFVLIVGLCVVLLAVLAVLLLAWVHDAAKSARATAQSAERIVELLQARALVIERTPGRVELDEAA